MDPLQSGSGGGERISLQKVDLITPQPSSENPDASPLCLENTLNL